MTDTSTSRRYSKQRKDPRNPHARTLRGFLFFPEQLLTDLRFSAVCSEARGVIWTLVCASWQLGELPTNLTDLARVTSCTYEELERTKPQWLEWFKIASRRQTMSSPWIEERRNEAVKNYEKHVVAQSESAKSRREKGFSPLHREQSASAAHPQRDSIRILNKKEEEEERSPPDGGQSETLSPSGNAGTRERWVSQCQQDRGGELRPWWSFLGKMAKEFGDAEVDKALAGCLELPDLPADPRGWVHDRLKQTQQYKAPESFPQHECWRREHAEAGCRGCCKKANDEARVDGKNPPYPNVQ